MHERWTFLRETQLRKDRGIAAVVVLAVITIVGLYDLGVAQLAEDPQKWFRARDIILWQPWYIWSIVLLVLLAIALYEGGYRAAKNRDRSIACLREESQADEVEQAIQALNRSNVTINYKTVSMENILRSLQTDFVAGTFTRNIAGLLKSHYGGGGNGDLRDASNHVLTELRIQGIITSTRTVRYGEYFPDSGAVEIRDDCWTLTEFGRRVILRLRQVADSNI